MRGAIGGGSSPLARGLPQDADGLLQAVRIIPARAGFTRTSHSGSPPSEDHPRSRGVYPLTDNQRTKTNGSSPLARGLPCARTGRNMGVWIIPARAGFTPDTGATSISTGIIPARAGFTRTSHSGSPPSEDHPRSRGVYPLTDNQRTKTNGSSPLARGLPCARTGRNMGVWIIPARAGFTAPGRPCRPCHPDHPRSRGVYANGSLTASPVGGSSPLARGLHDDRGGPAEQHRIIPARAGFTSKDAPDTSTSRDHPRSRGVYYGSFYVS